MKKPSAWKLIDFLSFGLFATIATLIVTYFTFAGPLTTATGVAVGAGAYVVMWAMALVFWTIYFSLVYTRYKYNNLFSITTKYGVMVCPNGYHVTKRNIEDILDKLVKAYDGSPVNAEKYIKKDIIWVYFEPNLIGKKYGETKKLWGFINVGGNQAWVSFAKSVKDDVPDPKKPLANTAFCHEIGHIILERALGTRNEKVHHDFMRDYDLNNIGK